MTKKIVLGTLGKAWGIKGQIKFYSANPNSDLIEHTRWVYISSGVLFSKLQIDSVQKISKSYVIQFVNISSPEQVSSYAGKELWVETSQMPKLKKDEFYVHTFLGLNVYDEDELVGVVHQIENYGAGNLLHIRGTHKNNEISFYLPLREEFIESIKLAEQKMIIKNWKDFL